MFNLKKEKIEKSKKSNIQKKNILLGTMLVSLIASIVIFLVMLNIEKNFLSDYEKSMVYTAKTMIPEGVVITQKNAEDYLAEIEMDKKIIPETALQTKEQLYGFAPIIDIDPGVLLTTGGFCNVNQFLESMEQPVIVGFKVDDLYQVVTGVLRSGDRIHIYVVSEDAETKEITSKLLWEDVFVQQVFDGSGVAIENEDTITAAQRMNIYFEKKDIEEFYKELAAGSLRIVKKIK